MLGILDGHGGGGADGTAGAVAIEPIVTSLAGPGTEVKGGDIIIFGGDGMTLDLSRMGAAALSASGSITLAAGAGSPSTCTAIRSRSFMPATESSLLQTASHSPTESK